MRKAVTGALALFALVAACSSGEGADEQEPWADEASTYFGHLSQAYLTNDFYGVLDFYAVSADVEKWRGAVRGGLPVSDLLRWNSGDLGHQLEAVFLADDAAMTLVLWPRSGDQGAVVSTMDQGRIAGETIFELSASLERSLRASPDVVSTYEGFYAAYAEAWSGADPDYRSRLYAADARVNDTLAGSAASGRADVGALTSAGEWRAVLNTAHSGGTGSAEGPSVYLGPRDYAQDPQRAIGVYEVTDAQGCTQLIGVHWLLEAGLIVDEHRYRELEGFRRCATDTLLTGWWTGLALPGPSDRVVTGTVRTSGGQEISIHNGTPRLEEFLQYGLARFEAAGLEEPILDTVTFEPSRSCEERSGRVLDDGASRDLFLCMYESDLCPGGAQCATPTLSARLAVLHELGHVWILDGVDDAKRERILALSGREEWDSLEVAWADRGTEYSAEVIAWGLLEEPIPLVRLGIPPCDELESAFAVITGTSSLREATDCPAK